MIHHLIEGGNVQSNILSFLSPYENYDEYDYDGTGLQGNYVLFCKQLLGTIQLLSTCQQANSLKRYFLERCFTKHKVGYYSTSLCHCVVYNVRDVKHTIALIRRKLENRYYNPLIYYSHYSGLLIDPPTFVC